jgi:hypothetical protein
VPRPPLQQIIPEEMTAALQRSGSGWLRQAKPISRAAHMRLVRKRIEDNEKIEVKRS